MSQGRGIRRVLRLRVCRTRSKSGDVDRGPNLAHGTAIDWPRRDRQPQPHWSATGSLDSGGAAYGGLQQAARSGISAGLSVGVGHLRLSGRHGLSDLVRRPVRRSRVGLVPMGHRSDRGRRGLSAHHGGIGQRRPRNVGDLGARHRGDGDRRAQRLPTLAGVVPPVSRRCG